MTFDDYRAGLGEIPQTMPAWQVFGSGLDNFGKDGKPVEIAVPEVGPDQLLARVDAAGLCFSDIKILNLGGDHPRLYGRDLANDPIVMGHEAAITIVKVGEKYEGKYKVGDRFVVQADIYYRGVNLAFGYMLPGALERYVALGAEVLEGDDGCYLIPLQPDTGYAEAALAEPWACVVCAYRVRPRNTLKGGGTVWVIGTPGCESVPYSVGGFEYSQSLPAKIVLTDVPAPVVARVKELAAGGGIAVSETAPFADLDLAACCAEGVDDIFILSNGSPDTIEAAATKLAKGGVLNLVASEPLDRELSIDIGRIHYEAHFYQGCKGPDVSRGYERTRGPEYKPGGMAWMIGGAGPMGQMHVQLALEMNNGPSVVVASDVDPERLATVPERFGAIADAKGKQLICLNPKELGMEAFEAKLREIAPGGFDDVVCLVPVPALVNHGSKFVAENGWLNVFAGVAKGTMANLDLSDVALRNVRYTGTSGSAIDDLTKTLHMTESRELNTNRSVAAVGGIEAAHEGLAGVKEARFSGKVIIFPQITGLPLTAIENLKHVLPEVSAKLAADGSWTREAEEALVAHYLP